MLRKYRIGFVEDERVIEAHAKHRAAHKYAKLTDAPPGSIIWGVLDSGGKKTCYRVGKLFTVEHVKCPRPGRESDE